jgi:hypothetical protein
MASLVSRMNGVCQPRTLTDRRNDITTIKSQPSPVGLSPADLVGEKPAAVNLVVESGNEVRLVRFAVASLPRPQWLTPTILRAGRLLSLPHDWDRQGAPPIDSNTIQLAMGTLSLIMNPNSSLPEWTPTQQSGVQLDWHESGADLEIAFEPSKSEGYVVFNDRNNSAEAWDGPVGQHLAALRELLRKRLIS